MFEVQEDTVSEVKVQEETISEVRLRYRRRLFLKLR